MLTTCRSTPPRISAWIVCLGLAMLIAAPAVTQACPLCKEAVSDDEVDDGAASGQTRTARGYAWSIGLMLCMPFLMVGGFAWMLVNAYRRNLQPHETDTDPAPPDSDTHHT